MGLKVWLPLNGDLHNQGCSNVTVTNNGATIDSNGKIGSCYYFNGSSWIKITLPTNMTTIQNTSICAWVKSTNSTLALGGISHDTGNNVIGSCTLYSSGWQFSGNGRWAYVSGGTVANTNVWHHVCCTIDNVNIITYLDGIQITTVTLTSKNVLTNLTSSNFIEIGCDHPGSNEHLTGYVNDFRVYDHCLSAAEVKEISQGLVLHYKLDQSNPNLISSNTFINAPWATAIAAHEEYEGRLAYRLQCKTLYTNTSSGTVNIFPDITYQENMQYTLSITWRDDYRTDNKNSNLRITFHYTDDSSTNRIQSPANTTQSWVHTKITSNSGKTVSKITASYGNSGYLYITDLKLEVGILDTGMLYTDGSIEDSSGYNHNGTITGNITLSSNTPRYSVSPLFNGTERITTTTLGADIRTLSCWCKTTKNKSTSQQMVADSFSNMTISFYQGTIIGVFGTTRSTGSKCTLGDSYKENDWNHIVVVKTDDAGARDIYCNGVKLTPASNDYWSPAAGFFVGARNTSNGNPFYGQISDVRAYCTALDADVIRQLYELGAKVDNKQNLHTFELIETDKQEITKQGQVKGQNLLETYLPLYDKNIYTEPDGSTWIHIFHHNNPANSKFNETTLDWTTGKYLDADRWYDVDQAIYYTLSPYEFMVKQKTTSSAAETKYRWVQTVNPLTAVWADVKPGTVTFNTSSGYTSSSYGGLYLLKSSSSHMCIANGSSSNWYGGIGVATAYNGGIPGYPNTTVTSGYVDLYMRVYNGTKIIKNVGISSTEFIEL